MKGYLIYYPQEAVKNQWFIQSFQEEGASVGIDFEYISVYEYKKSQKGSLPSLVLNRTRRPEVSRWYQERGIPVFHEDILVELANDKYKSIQYFSHHLPTEVLKEKWCPGSRLLPKEELERIFLGEKKLPGDMVVKSLDGHGGMEVFLTEEIQESLLANGMSDVSDRTERFLALRGRDCMLQERIPGAGKDLRIYVLGGEIYQAVLRTGQGDFRSNFSMGGSVRAYELNGKQEDWVRQFIRALPGPPSGMFGIDFMIDCDGRLVFNEIEEMAGCRMLYQCTSRDMVRDYVDWLRVFMKHDW